jgi:hypothetical protein
MKDCTIDEDYFLIMYFGYLLQPPPPLCELARPAEWGFVIDEDYDNDGTFDNDSNYGCLDDNDYSNHSIDADDCNNDCYDNG